MSKKLISGCLVGGCAAVIALALWFSGALETLEYTTWTWRVRHLARPSSATDKIKLILLDQSSLVWAEEENGLAWPWPREVYGPILDFCRRGGARTIAFDVLFTEPSVYGVADDEALGAAIDKVDSFVGALFLGRQTGQTDAWPAAAERHRWNVSELAEWLQQDRPELLFAPYATFPVGEVLASASALANVSDFPDSDGIFRRASLIRMFDGEAVPTLGLAAYLADSTGTGQRSAVQLSDNWLNAGDLRLPIDDAGRTILRFVGPTGTHHSVTAAAVIQSELRLRSGAQPVLDPELFRDSYVFFGFSAPGLLDLRPTPAGRVFPGVEIHATVLDNLLSGQYLRDAPSLFVVVITVALAVLAALMILFVRRVRYNVLTFVILLPLPLLLGWGAYAIGYWWPVVVGEGAVVMALVGGVVLNYVTEGRQRKFIKQAFKYYLSPEVIEKILEDPTELRLGGERRELTLLFADLQEFTSISENLDPQTLTALLNEYLSDMTDIVLSEGGTLDKYEGDAFIAFWNAPASQPDHARRACRAAIRCQRRLATRRAEFLEITGRTLRMRIGINTGDVVVGNMGSRQRFNYTVLGDAANLASRLEGANKAFGTFAMISEATYAQAQADILVREIGRLRVVGRKIPVRVYQLIGSKSDQPLAGQEIFQKGLDLYYRGEIAAAGELFDRLTGDPVAEAYARRCQQLAVAPDDYRDGVWKLTEK